MYTIVYPCMYVHVHEVCFERLYVCMYSLCVSAYIYTMYVSATIIIIMLCRYSLCYIVPAHLGLCVPYCVCY